MSKSISRVQADRIIETKFGTQFYLIADADEIGFEKDQYITEAALQSGKFNIPEGSPGLIIHREVIETLEFDGKQYPGTHEHILTAYIKEGAIVTQAQAAEISPDLHAEMVADKQAFVIATPCDNEEGGVFKDVMYFTNLVGSASKMVTLSGEDGDYKQTGLTNIVGGKHRGGTDADMFRTTAWVSKPVVL